MSKKQVYVIAHNLRSAHNIGALLRTAEGIGVTTVYITGYSPYPTFDGDQRLPHISRKLTSQIAKTALGAEQEEVWEYRDNIEQLMIELKTKGVQIIGLEQDPRSIPLNTFQTDKPIALLLGREVEGIEDSLLSQCDVVLEIPMKGKKESFNVVEAASMALYQLCIL